jgi:hypothetical protein
MTRRPLSFAANVDPSAASLAEAHAIARRADELGLDLIGIQEHPYQWRFLDTWMPMATLLAKTERVRVFPNVANLPLRGPAVIAKQAVSLDVLSGAEPVEHWVEQLTRFVAELGFDTFTFWARDNYVEQLERFAREIVPGVVEATGRPQAEE